MTSKRATGGAVWIGIGHLGTFIGTTPDRCTSNPDTKHRSPPGAAHADRGSPGPAGTDHPGGPGRANASPLPHPAAIPPVSRTSPPDAAPPGSRIAGAGLARNHGRPTVAIRPWQSDRGNTEAMRQNKIQSGPQTSRRPPWAGAYTAIPRSRRLAVSASAAIWAFKASRPENFTSARM